MAAFLDCCSLPELNGLRVVTESRRDLESVARCTACGSYWFYRFHEYGDDTTSWYTPLSPAEAEQLLTDPGGVDLAFLKSRPSWMHDDDGVRRVDGAPDHPWS